MPVLRRAGGPVLSPADRPVLSPAEGPVPVPFVLSSAQRLRADDLPSRIGSARLKRRQDVTADLSA